MIKWKIKPNNFNLFIALGCVIKGETYHFEVISDSVGKALLDIVNQNKNTLISNGIINAYSKSQAIKRSKSKNKGKEAANAMVKMIECLI
jgi:6,7-dimethyl-8-ribityllumazine synthase